jgi:hypothetical protein
MIGTKVGVRTIPADRNVQPCPRCGIPRNLRMDRPSEVCNDCRFVEADILTWQILELHDEGLSDRAIGERLGMDTRAVFQRRKRARGWEA